MAKIYNVKFEATETSQAQVNVPEHSDVKFAVQVLRNGEEVEVGENQVTAVIQGYEVYPTETYLHRPVFALTTYEPEDDYEVTLSVDTRTTDEYEATCKAEDGGAIAALGIQGVSMNDMFASFPEGTKIGEIKGDDIHILWRDGGEETEYIEYTIDDWQAHVGVTMNNIVIYGSDNQPIAPSTSMYVGGEWGDSVKDIEISDGMNFCFPMFTGESGHLYAVGFHYVKVNDGFHKNFQCRINVDNTSIYEAGGDSGYVLPPATRVSLGGIIVGENLGIDENGVLSANSAGYELPIASARTLGGVKIGDNLAIDEHGVLSAKDTEYTLPVASNDTLGGVIIDGNNLAIDAHGVLSAANTTYTLPTATASTLGGVKVGDNLSITDGVLSAKDTEYTLPTATASVLGGVKVGDSLTIDEGVLDYTLPKASALTVGGIRVGRNLSVDSDGVLSAVIPVANMMQVGGVKSGDQVQVNFSTGVMSINTSYLTPATSAVNGVVSIGDGLTVDEYGYLSANFMTVTLAEWETLSASAIAGHIYFVTD